MVAFVLFFLLVFFKQFPYFHVTEYPSPEDKQMSDEGTDIWTKHAYRCGIREGTGCKTHNASDTVAHLPSNRSGINHGALQLCCWPGEPCNSGVIVPLLTSERQAISNEVI